MGPYTKGGTCILITLIEYSIHCTIFCNLVRSKLYTRAKRSTRLDYEDVMLKSARRHKRAAADPESDLDPGRVVADPENYLVFNPRKIKELLKEDQPGMDVDDILQSY